VKGESIVFAVAGALFGLIAGWVIGSQQAGSANRVAPAAVQQQASGAAGGSEQPAVLNEGQVQALRTVAEQNPKDPQPRVQLGNLFFDAERYNDAITWYEAATALDPSDPNVSTDLGVAYYYTNQPDRALAQFDKSLATDPKHIKTLLNVGIVRAFGKNDLAGAAKAWETVVAISPDSPEGQAAKKGLEGVKNAGAGTAGK
jgi:cytochrome c-type biogenesis protein CcmH/NrfG